MSRPSLTDHHESLTKVWVQLAADRQTQVIRLMAQMVFKLIVQQIDASGKEVTYAIPSLRTKNPT
ncbi:MAG: hypothetical protein HN413_13830 [Chloroflexi bacterium]|jgi:hypothetical protein|nr:hypothetical protein [Chloroflexota bacterium]